MKANTKRLNKLMDRDEAVSPVIAVILMVAITVVLAATVYVWVSGFGSSQSKQINAQLTAVGGGGTGTAGQIILKHSSGDSISTGNWKVSITPTGASTTFCTPASSADLAAGSQYVYANQSVVGTTVSCSGTDGAGTPDGSPLVKGTVYQVKVVEIQTSTVLLDREITA